MKIIGITQRVDHRKEINEKRDCLDQRWMILAKTLGVIFVPIPNTLEDPVAYIIKLNVSGIIFSGGNHVGNIQEKQNQEPDHHDVFVERDRTEQTLLSYALQIRIPLLGVCRGMQMIYAFFGGELKKVDKNIHVAHRHALEWKSDQMANFYKNQMDVNSYHGYGISSPITSARLEETGIYNDEVESFKVKDFEVYGVMWHPEREEPFSDGDIQFLKYIFKIHETN